MPEPGNDPIKKKGQDLRRMSMALAVPGIFMAVPVIGYLGYLVGKKFFDSGGPGFLIGLVLGFVVAVRETFRILKQLSQDEKEKSGK